MKNRRLSKIVPIVCISVVPAFALSSEWGFPLNSETNYLASYEDPDFSAESLAERDLTNAPSPDWFGAAAGAIGRVAAYGGIGRAGMMVARGARGMEYLHDAGYVGGDAYQIARDGESKQGRESDFDY